MVYVAKTTRRDFYYVIKYNNKKKYNLQYDYDVIIFIILSKQIIDP